MVGQAAGRRGDRGRRAAVSGHHRRLPDSRPVGAHADPARHAARAATAAVHQARPVGRRRGAGQAGAGVSEPGQPPGPGPGSPRARGARAAAPGGPPRPLPLPADAFDSHCHLDMIERPAEEIVAEAGAAGIASLAALPQVRAVGETGLDYYRDWADPALQRDSFRAHIAIAKAAGKALMIHDRDAHEDVLRMLAAEGAPAQVVFHCFSGDAAMAKRCADAGYVMSFA